jgi:hypothetical protein
MFSDNGTNLAGSERELRESIQAWNTSHKLQDYLQQKEITWHFNTPLASHMAGVVERQIRTVRKVLSAMLKGAVLDDERLLTLFCEAENIVNGRPITKISSDPRDDRALTPNDLLLLQGSTGLPPGVFSKANVYDRRWRHAQLLANNFWTRWTKEYLPLINKRSKWLEQKENIAVGEVVLLCDGTMTMHRNCWPIARVLEVKIGRDQLVRTVTVKTATGVYVRPVTKIARLEGVQ